jgi:lysine biosynthesis protein LysW
MTSKTDASLAARRRTAIATCPDCGEKINLMGVVQIGTRVFCSNCEANLEVIATLPVELEWVNEDFVDQGGRW